MVKSKKTLTCIADQTVPAETIDGDISKESDLSEKETALAEKENELTAKEIELTQKETDLKNREDAIAEKEKAIEGNADKKVEVIK